MDKYARIEAGTRVRVLPGYTACNGNDPADDTDQVFKDAWRDGGIFYISYLHAPDSDGDYTVNTRSNGMGQRKYVHHDFVELAPEGEDVPASSTVTVEEAFKPGNEIEFSVTGIEFTDYGLRKGCKSLDFTQQGAWNAVIKMDTVAKTATFRATILGSGVIQVPGGAGINRFEAAEHFKDIKITKVAEPSRPEVTVTLTADELDKIIAVMGKGVGNQTLYRKLYAVDEYVNKSSEYRVNFHDQVFSVAKR